jgi:hypothetical protein
MNEPTDDPEANRARKRVVPLAMLALVSVLAACTANPATGGPAGAPSASTPSVTSISPTTSPTTTGVNTTIDGAGDVTPSFLDIVAMRASADSGSLTLGLDLAAAVPAGSPTVGQLAYLFYLDVDSDGAWDYTAALTLVPEGGFRPSLLGRGSTPPLEGPAFPGTANLAGSTISLTLRLDAIGCPSSVGVRAASQQTKAGATAGDQIPDAPEAWTPVETGCQPAGS